MTTKSETPAAAHDAVAFLLTPTVPKAHAGLPWAPLAPLEVQTDDDGQRWALVRMPIGEPIGRAARRADAIEALGIIHSGAGACSVVRLSMPPEVAEQFLVGEPSTPELRGMTFDRASRLLEDLVEGK